MAEAAGAEDDTCAWALLIEYDGRGFAGWQRQNGQPTLQELLEDSAARLAGRAVASTAAGRTDAGVHAEGQVALIALPRRFTADQVRNALNHHMKPHRMVVQRAVLAPSGWHPRFSAIARHYRYRILNRPARPALSFGQVWHIAHRLDEAAMQQAARALLGRHDFTSFRARSCQAKSPIRTLDRLDITRTADLVTILVEARSFLHHQVRNMVGTLVLVGATRWQPLQVAVALEARDRRAAGPTAPPEGLCLTQVVYAASIFSD